MPIVSARARFAAVFSVLGLLVLLLVGVVLIRADASPDENARSDAVRADLVIRVIAGPGWRVTDHYVALRVLVMNVQTDRADAVEEIARQIVAKIDEPQDEVLVYFHRTTATSERSFAGVQWTPERGYRTWSLE